MESLRDIAHMQVSQEALLTLTEIASKMEEVRAAKMKEFFGLLPSGPPPQADQP